MTALPPEAAVGVISGKTSATDPKLTFACLSIIGISHMMAYELADLAQSNFANATSAFAVFLSVVFAYIVTAYLVGAKLTHMQNRIVTFLFLLVSIFNSWAIAAYASGGARLSQLAYPENPNHFFRAGPWVAPLVGIVCLLIIVMALKFMWDVRHAKTTNFN